MSTNGWTTQPPREPYFDGTLGAWVVSRYQDVTVALRESRLVPASARSTAAAASRDDAVHARFRAETIRFLSPAKLQRWEAHFKQSADGLANALPAGEPVDLMKQYAKPWSLTVAGLTAEVPDSERPRLSDLAGSVFHAACEPYDPELEAAGREAAAEMARYFQGAPAIYVQMFVALACSLPSFLGSVIWALLQNPLELARLRQEPALISRAIDELLRYAGPARAQFRQAAAALAIGGCAIEPQQRVILMLDSANRDPQQFPEPDQLRLQRRDGNHVAFGGGLHACVGGMLIQSAASAAIQVLIGRLALTKGFTAAPVECFGLRYLRSLTVVW